MGSIDDDVCVCVCARARLLGGPFGLDLLLFIYSRVVCVHNASKSHKGANALNCIRTSVRNKKGREVWRRRDTTTQRTKNQQETNHRTRLARDVLSLLDWLVCGGRSTCATARLRTYQVGSDCSRGYFMNDALIDDPIQALLSLELVAVTDCATGSVALSRTWKKVPRFCTLL